MDKLGIVKELRRLALIMGQESYELPKRTPEVLREAAKLIEESLRRKKPIAISELGLSAHAYNALYRRGWLTVEEVKTKTMPELLRVCGIGEKTATEILLAVERIVVEDG